MVKLQILVINCSRHSCCVCHPVVPVIPAKVFDGKEGYPCGTGISYPKNSMKSLLISILRKYQRYLSPDHSLWAKAMNKPPYCKHTPSCSDYAIEAIEKKGVLVGGLKGLGRVLRCNPWSKGGYDPVEK